MWRACFLVLPLVVVAVIGDSYESLSNNMAPVGRVDIFPAVLSFWDTRLFLLLSRGLSNPLLDVFFLACTFLGSVSFTVLLWGILFLTNRRIESSLAAVSLLLVTGVTALLKLLVARPRPFQVLDEVIPLVYESGSSFPSGHTARAFSLSHLPTGLGRGLRFMVYAFAVLVGFSRVYLGVHYPLDVLCGVFLGWAVGWLVERYRDMLSEKGVRVMVRLGVWAPSNL